MGFLFAPMLHGAMKHAIGPRREIAMRSIFNVMGPLTNPARAQSQLVGVYAPELTELVADVLRQVGCKKALVVHGSDGMDELTLTGPSRVSEWDGSEIRTYDVTPEDAGLDRADADAVKGGEPAENAEITRAILGGERGPRRDIVLLNAAAALIAADRAGDLREGVTQAATAIDSGEAAGVLARLVEVSNS